MPNEFANSVSSDSICVSIRTAFFFEKQLNIVVYSMFLFLAASFEHHFVQDISMSNATGLQKATEGPSGVVITSEIPVIGSDRLNVLMFSCFKPRYNTYLQEYCNLTLLKSQRFQFTIATAVVDALFCKS